MMVRSVVVIAMTVRVTVVVAPVRVSAMMPGTVMVVVLTMMPAAPTALAITGSARLMGKGEPGAKSERHARTDCQKQCPACHERTFRVLRHGILLTIVGIYDILHAYPIWVFDLCQL